MKKLLSVILVICSLLGGNAYAKELTGDETISELLDKGFKIINEVSNTSNTNMSMIKIFTLHDSSFDKLVICRCFNRHIVCNLWCWARFWY